MKKLQLKKWDAAEYIRTKKDAALYLEAAFEDGDPNVIVHVFRDIARSCALGKIARSARVDPTELAKDLLRKPSLKLGPALKVLSALRLKLKVAA